MEKGVMLLRMEWTGVAGCHGAVQDLLVLVLEIHLELAQWNLRLNQKCNRWSRGICG
jgi:hypothetical protein